MIVIKVLAKFLDVITVGIIIVCIGLVTPILFHIKPYVVMSGSMEPKIHTGAVAYVDTNFTGAEAEIGDIIAFESGDIFVTHRVVDIDASNELITKGDANDAEDIAPISRDKVIGKTVFSVPFVGYVIERVRGKLLMYVAALIILLNVMMNLLLSGAEDDKKNKLLAIEENSEKDKGNTDNPNPIT